MMTKTLRNLTSGLLALLLNFLLGLGTLSANTATGAKGVIECYADVSWGSCLGMAAGAREVAGWGVGGGKHIGLKAVKGLDWFQQLAAKYGDELAEALVVKYGTEAKRFATNRPAGMGTD